MNATGVSGYSTDSATQYTHMSHTGKMPYLNRRKEKGERLTNKVLTAVIGCCPYVLGSNAICREKYDRFNSTNLLPAGQGDKRSNT